MTKRLHVSSKGRRVNSKRAVFYSVRWQRVRRLNAMKVQGWGEFFFSHQRFIKRQLSRDDVITYVSTLMGILLYLFFIRLNFFFTRGNFKWAYTYNYIDQETETPDVT